MKKMSNPLSNRKSDSLNEKTLNYQLKRTRSLQSIKSKSSAITIQSKCHYKLSTQHIYFLMQEERMKELQTIKNSRSILEYYQTFNSLLLIIYKTSKLILTYMYYNKTRELKVDRLQVLNVLMGNFSDDWNQEKIRKLEILSTNLYEMSKDQKDFQKRVEYVSRKLCNNKEKRKKIESAYLNKSLKQQWKKIIQKAQYFQRNCFIHDMFNSYSKKQCFFDVRFFLNNTLSKLQFKQKIQRFCCKQDLDDDLGLDYTFEFVLLQEFSFESSEVFQFEQGQDKISPNKSGCCIM